MTADGEDRPVTPWPADAEKVLAQPRPARRAAMPSPPARRTRQAWATVAVLLTAAVLCGLAVVAMSVPIGLAGVLVGLAGAGFAVHARIFSDVH